jgi:hypothetical protein
LLRVVGGPAADGVHDAADLGHRGEDDDGDAGMEALDAVQRLEPAHARHDEIEEHRRGAGLPAR